jgi:hypothetical protein
MTRNEAEALAKTLNTENYTLSRKLNADRRNGETEHA